MNPRLRTALILAGIAVAAYVGYRWWQNRNASSSQGLGSNLGSVGYLVGGSTGPSSGLNYYAASPNITLNEPVTSPPPGRQFLFLPPATRVPPIIGAGDQIVPGSNNVQNLSWTNTGQKWSAATLANKLQVPISSLRATNAQAQKALKNPKALMPKGSKFTYQKAA